MSSYNQWWKEGSSLKMVFKLIGVTDNHPVIKSSDFGFLLLMQHAALLGLKDSGQLNEMQCRQAEESLLDQFRNHVKSIHIEENGDD